jgi:hypothetical protein
MRPPPRAMLTLLAAALALAAAPRRVAAREVATGGVQTSAVGDTGRAASQAAYFDPRPPVDCRALVFTGIAGDCNLDAGGNVRLVLRDPAPRRGCAVLLRPRRRERGTVRDRRGGTRVLPLVRAVQVRVRADGRRRVRCRG